MLRMMHTHDFLGYTAAFLVMVISVAAICATLYCSRQHHG